MVVARFVGDGIAFVVAETLSQARDAAELVAVDYEPLPVIASTRDATRPGSAQVWPDCPENISYRYKEGGANALNKINLRVKKGQSIDLTTGI